MAAGPHYTTTALTALLNTISGSANAIHLVDPYDTSDNRATVIANSKGSASIGGGNFTTPTDKGDRAMTMNFTGATGTASQTNTTPIDPYLVIISGGEVLAATNETSDKVVYNGDSIVFPTFYLDAVQPVQE